MFLVTITILHRRHRLDAREIPLVGLLVTIVVLCVMSYYWTAVPDRPYTRPAKFYGNVVISDVFHLVIGENIQNRYPSLSILLSIIVIVL